MSVDHCSSRQSTGSGITFTSAEFEHFTRDVAARIIQHHWRMRLAKMESLSTLSPAPLGADHQHDTQQQILARANAPESETLQQRLGDNYNGASSSKQQTVQPDFQHLSPAHQPAASLNVLQLSVQSEVPPDRPAAKLSEPIAQDPENAPPVGLDAGKGSMKSFAASSGTASAQGLASTMPLDHPRSADRMLHSGNALPENQLPLLEGHAAQSNGTSSVQSSHFSDSTPSQAATFNHSAEALAASLDKPRPLVLLPLGMPKTLQLSEAATGGPRRVPRPDARYHQTQAESQTAKSAEPPYDSGVQASAEATTQTLRHMPIPQGAQAGLQSTAASSDSVNQVSQPDSHAIPLDRNPDVQQENRSAAGSSLLLKRTSHAESNTSGASDTGQSISSSIAAQLIPEQRGSLMLSHPALDSHVPGRIALQQEGWRAPKSSKRTHRGGAGSSHPSQKATASRLSDENIRRSDGKPPLQHGRRPAEGPADKSMHQEVGGSKDLRPNGAAYPRKRQHRVESRASPVPTLHNEGWHADGASVSSGQAAGLLQPSRLGQSSPGLPISVVHVPHDPARDIGAAGTSSEGQHESRQAAQADAEDSMDRNGLAEIPAGPSPQGPAGVRGNMAPDAAAGPNTGGQNDKMKDIMSFLDAVEAQVTTTTPCNGACSLFVTGSKSF